MNVILGPCKRGDAILVHAIESVSARATIYIAGARVRCLPDFLFFRISFSLQHSRSVLEPRLPRVFFTKSRSMPFASDAHKEYVILALLRVFLRTLVTIGLSTAISRYLRAVCDH